MKDKESFYGTTMDSPVGRLTLLASTVGLVGIYFENRFEGLWEKEDCEILRLTQAQLEAYFEGSRHEFDLPLDLRGTEFQKQVWQALATIPFGHTCSYRELAEQVGRPKASRAIGLANGSNPISIVLPCHRVIGSNGKLVGYGGGLDRKLKLLQFEGALLAIAG